MGLSEISMGAIPMMVSVVIPAYNAEKYIKSTVDSVLSQTYPKIEVIIVDDGSSDNTIPLVRSFGDKVILLEQNHKGVSAARNLGISSAQGEYIAFIDADDLWLPHKIERQMEALKTGGYQWSYCDIGWIDASTGKKVPRRYPRRHDGFILEKLFLNCFIASPTPVIRRSIFDDVGFFHEQTEFGEDRDMWMRIAAKYPIKYIPDVLALVRKHPSSSTHTIPVEMKLRNQISTIERTLAIDPIRLRPLVNYKMSTLYYLFSKECVAHNDINKARNYINKSLKLYPYSFHSICLFLLLRLDPAFVIWVLKINRFKRHPIR